MHICVGFHVVARGRSDAEYEVYASHGMAPLPLTNHVHLPLTPEHAARVPQVLISVSVGRGKLGDARRRSRASKTLRPKLQLGTQENW